MSLRIAWAVCLVLVGEAAVWGQATAPRTAPTPAELDAWVAELNSDVFVNRESATQRLIGAGRAGIERVEAAVTKGPLEVVIRGVHVLREVALSEEGEAQEAAQAALERIASAQLTAAARRAEVTMASLSETRQARAVDELQRLGARVGISHMQLGFQIVEQASVLEIGTEWQGKTTDLSRLRWLSGIQEVRFTGPQVTNDWLSYLRNMPQVTRLTLSRTEVTSAGLSVLRDLGKLQIVWIKYSPVDDAVVPHLLALKHIAQLKLYGTKVSREAARRLSDELVNAKVDHRRGGFLGVNCQAHPLGCEVVLVQPGTAAAGAGLEAGDVIIKYGPHRVETFETLTTFIAENQPGDKVDLLVARDLRVRRSPFEHRAGEELGLELKPHALGCEVVAVAPGSLGARLAFKAGDVITSYMETRVLEPPALVAAFRAGEAGSQASLDFVRQPQLLTKTVSLGEWE
ncbi:MAG: PDZ domain-containing protein [Pirellulales bacterium]